MIAPTHITFASALYLAGATVLEYRTDPFGWALACVASLGPDIDLPASRPRRMLFFLSTRLEHRFGHRTITHSLLGLAAVAVLAAPLLFWEWNGC